MSAEKPEVGDVWEDDDNIYHVMNVCGSHLCCLTQYKRRKSFRLEWIKYFSEMKYLGKSKANINKLFEVDND